VTAVSTRHLAKIGIGAALLAGYGLLMWRGFLEEMLLLRPFALLLGAAAVVGCAVGALRPAWLRRVRDAILAVPTWLFVGVCMAVALATTLYVGYLVGGFSYGTPDEATYVFQSRMLAGGHLYAPAPAHHEFFQFRFCLQQGGRWFGIFPPGWPAVLALGIWLGAPHLVNPVLGALLVLLAYLLAREVAPGRPLVWRLVAVLGACSIARMSQTATLMSHPLGAVCTTTALLGGLLAVRTGHGRWLLLVGACLGLQANTRLLNAFALGVPCLWLVLLFAWRHRTTPRRVALALGGLTLVVGLFAGVQLAYNHALTGSASRFPQREYFAATEMKPNCSDPGFGADRVCTHEHPPMLGQGMPRNEFYLQHGLRVSYVRFDAYSREAASGVVLFAFLIIGLVARDTRRAAALCLLGYGSLWAAYVTFYYHGLAYGSRYYFEATACVWIGVALGLVAALRLVAPAGRLGAVALALRGGAAAVVLLLIVVQPISRWPHAQQLWFRNLTSYHQPVVRAIAGLEQAGIKSIVEHPLEWGPAVLNKRPWDLPSQTVIVAHDVGFDSAEELLRHYPGRKLFRWNQGLQKLEAVAPDPERVIIEPELFFPRTPSRYGYAQLAMGLNIICLKLFGARAGAQTQFVAHFPEGRYEVRPMVISGPDAGRLRLEIDGQPLVGDLDLFAPRIHPVFPAPRLVDLHGENHLVRMTVVGKNNYSMGHTVCVDRLVLDRIPASQPVSRPASQPAR
jgi:4-amino-4-deoxy-L-arabinose transferase-like glycosyltransferase